MIAMSAHPASQVHSVQPTSSAWYGAVCPQYGQCMSWSAGSSGPRGGGCGLLVAGTLDPVDVGGDVARHRPRRGVELGAALLDPPLAAGDPQVVAGDGVVDVSAQCA